MAREPMGKVLLRNVIRHTGAHNKIQEESEMWKMRDMEKTPCPKQMPAMDGNRGHMHCDRSESRARSGSRERSSGHNEREARYWTRKLYEFEAKDPDRWGHSGFKELYPEEFRIEGEGGAGDKNNKHRKKKKSSETGKSKSSKKSLKKKKKKKSDGKRKREDASGNESRDEGSADATKKQKTKRSKSKHRRKRRERSRGREEESSSEDSDGEGGGRTQNHGKRQRNSDKGSQPGLETHKKRRKDWKAPNEERSEGSSDE